MAEGAHSAPVRQTRFPVKTCTVKTSPLHEP